jgi:hypothetical protein
MIMTRAKWFSQNLPRIILTQTWVKSSLIVAASTWSDRQACSACPIF